MFTSTGNNFGGGVIQFKDVQESNYLILNAKLTADSDSATYQAVDQLEIYVPDLSIDRSVVCGVICQYQDRGEAYGSPYNYDAGTVLKSWIKDKNTIVIEKLPQFDNKGVLTIWIQAMYCQLNQGGNTIKGTRTRITFSDPLNKTSWDFDSICVIFERWVFVTAQISYASSDNVDFSSTMQGFPTDVSVELPLIVGTCYGNSKMSAVNPCRIDAGVWSIRNEDKTSGFSSSSNKQFFFAYLVRDGEGANNQDPTDEN